MTVHRTVIEHRVTQQTGSDMADPADVKVPADQVPERPDYNRAAVDRTAHVPRDARQPTAEVSPEAAGHVQPASRARPAEQVSDAPPPESDRPRGLVNPVSRVQASDVETPAPARDRLVRPEAIRPLREPVATTPVAAPRQAAAPSAAPRIEVNIGRVEVRAVYAQSSQAAARKQPSPPPTSLDDYLKQRDRTG
jgi:hypothetical protein